MIITAVLIICAATVGAFFYARIDKNSYIYDRAADSASFTGTGILLKGEEIRQTFKADEKYIDGVNIKTTVTDGADDVSLRYVILSESGKELSYGKVSAGELKNNRFNVLRLPRIENAKGKKFILALREEKSEGAVGVSFYTASGADDKERGAETLTVRGEKADGVLVMRTVCHRFDAETFIVFLGMLTFIAAFIRLLYRLFR